MPLQIHDLVPVDTTAVESKWRRIVTRIPVPESVPLLMRLRSVEPRSMAGMPPVVWHEAEGFLVRDPYGNQWIDLTGGIMIANSGHANPRIRDAIRRTANGKLLLTYAFPSMQRLRLLEYLVSLSPIPDSKAILFCAGTEATECAMLLMRKHGTQQHKQKTGILSFRGSYHGRTMAAVLAGGAPANTDWLSRGQVSHYQLPFPFCPQCPWKRTSYQSCGADCFHDSLRLLEDQGTELETIAGIIFEPLPGWATWPIPCDYARALKAWADRNDVIVAADEVQTGCGRTGRFFGFEHLGIVPDLMALGKGVSSSLPVSAVVGRRSLLDMPVPGEMSSTHGGNPLCAAAALANLSAIVEEGLVERSARTGQLILRELEPLKHLFPERILSIHGQGLFISVHLRQPQTGDPDAVLADQVVHEAVRRGVLMFVTGRGFLKIAPPLSIDPQAAREAVKVLIQCLSDVVAKDGAHE